MHARPLGKHGPRGLIIAVLFSLFLVAHASRLEAAEKPDLYLLAIGVSEYQDPGIPDLHYAHEDAAAFERWARAQEGRIYNRVHARSLVDADATRTKVIQTLLEHFRAARPDDQLILFLSGHGVIDPVTSAWHFLTADSQRVAIAGTALEQHDILRKLESGGVHSRVVVLVDTCQSGALADAVPAEGKGLFVAGDARPLDDEVARQREGAWVVFTAGTSGDKAIEGPQFRLPGEPEEVHGHGLFTWSVLSALGGTAADRDGNGIVTLNEFQAYVSEQVREASSGKQIPVISGRQTDIALAFATGTQERCDGVDNDLDGHIDEGFDENHNGIGDCLESERCNGLDDNGDGQVDEGFDLDGDGHRDREQCGQTYGDDCDDQRIAIHPGQKDWGNLRDDDCDGLIDEDDFDRDGDGVTDTIQSRDTLLRRARWLSLGVGAALTLGGVAGKLELNRLEQPDPTLPQPYEVTEPQERRYGALRAVTSGLFSSGGLFIGASIGFTFYDLDFRKGLFPRRRPGAAVLADAGTTSSTQAGGTPR
jgi:uncharacterized caspase-like protein